MQYYIQEKAKKFLTSGYLLYRNQDFFHLPPVDLSPAEHQALYDICRQIMENKGFQSYYPISASLAHIHLFMEMLHFRIVDQNEEAIQVQHIINKHKPELLYCILRDFFTKSGSLVEQANYSQRTSQNTLTTSQLESYWPSSTKVLKPTIRTR